MPQFFVLANDVLSGKIALDGLDGVCVTVYRDGFKGWGVWEKRLEAVNCMEKFAWRLRACLESYGIVEDPGTT